MGAITRAAANNITTGGVILPAGINDASVASITALSGVSTGGAMTRLSTQTASASASISFTSGIDSTYRTYLFKFINIDADNTGNHLLFQCSTDGGSSYGVALTSTLFRAYHYENDTGASLDYITASDLANSTSYQPIIQTTTLDNDADHGISGSFYLFSPSNTTFVKHFLGISNSAELGSFNHYLGGFLNTTSAINAIDFKLNSGNINSGTIIMYGIT